MTILNKLISTTSPVRELNETELQMVSGGSATPVTCHIRDTETNPDGSVVVIYDGYRVDGAVLD